MAKINVLIFSAGEINSIELHDALSSCVNVELWGASSIDRHGEYVFKNYIPNIPLINEPDFFDRFNKILDDRQIDLVFPTHDTIVEFFAQNIDKIHSRVICADKLTSEICRDKKKTYDLFKEYSFCPKKFDNFSEFPVFIKPRKGQGAIGAKVVKTKYDIPTDINFDDYVICEYLPNEEYTVDCLTDKNGILKAILPRSRKRLMAGICVSGKNENLTDEINNIAQIINDKLNFKGLWYFQIKKDIYGNFKLLEISTRCAGTMCLSRSQGVNLPLLSVYTAMGYDIDVIKNPYNIIMDRALISRYKIDYNYDTVYLDFDDTLVVNNKVYLPVIRFLYQCKNQEKKIVLISKHDGDLYKSLEDLAISKNLFDEILHLKNNEKKIDFIVPEKAIFIDNAFQERISVHKKFNIPVFDVEGIEVLLDWRI